VSLEFFILGKLLTTMVKKFTVATIFVTTSTAILHEKLDLTLA
jgi:hypothetical protein